MGHSMKRKEDPRFIRGQGNYVDDIKLPGMLHMDIVRSPYAHAKIQAIDTAKALKIPGVLAVITGETLEEVQPALDADADVGHPDGAADRQGDVPGAGGRGGDRHRPLHRRRRRRRGGGRVRAAAGDRRSRSRRSSPARRSCAPTRRTRRTTTSSTGRRATGPPPTRPSPRPDVTVASRTSTCRASTSPRSRPAAASPTSTRVDGQAHRLHDHAGAARHAHGLRAGRRARRPLGGEDPHRLARHRRRLRRQGAGLSRATSSRSPPRW